MRNSYADYALQIKSISDETRLKIINMISKKELCACHILEEFNITQPTLSYHMKILIESGIVNKQKEGSWVKYKLNKEVWNNLMKFLNEIIKEEINKEFDENKCK